MDLNINISELLNEVSNYYSPKIVAEVNDVYIKLVKIKGEKVPWHNHKDEDELFYILKGSLKMEIEHNEPFYMTKGDLYVVKKGVNHRVSSVEECHMMLIENKTTSHTGKVVSEISKTIDNQHY